MINLEEINSIIEKSAEINNTTFESVMQPNRKALNVAARQMCYTLLKEHDFGWSEIGRIFNKNHASIINGVKNHERDYKALNYYKDNYDRLKLFINDPDEVILFDKQKEVIETLRGENANLRDRIYEIKQLKIKLIKSLEELCE